MKQRLTLSKRVRKATLSRFVPIIAIISFIAIFLAYGVINYQVTKSQESHLSEFAETYYRTIDALDRQVASLARNDLMINSLIDFSNRDSYLPVFFRSLTPNNLVSADGEFSIAFTDFEGEVIAGKHIDSFKEAERHFNWKPQSLDSGKPFLDVSEHGLLVVHPVIYGGSAEGAIAFHINNLAAVIRFEPIDYNLIVGDNAKLIYNANERFIESGTEGYLETSAGLSGMLSTSTHLPLSKTKDPEVNSGKSLTITAIQSYLSAYSNAAWVTGALIIILSIILFTTFFSIQITSNIASDIINRLREQIALARDRQGSFRKMDGSENESTEIKELRETFNSVMEELFATTFVKERVEGVIDSLGEMLVVYDLEGEEIMANTAFRSLCLSCTKRSENDKQNIFPDGFVIPQASSSPTIIKHNTLNADHPHHVSWMRTLYKNADNKVIGIILTGIDLTESIELQQELTLKNQAIDEAQTPIIIADASVEGFPITYVNRAFEEQTGYKFDEVKGTNCKFLQGKNTDPADVEIISTALRERRPLSKTILNYRKDGSEFYNHLSLTPIRDIDGNVTHFLGFQSDITNQERTQQFLEQARRKAEDSAKLKSEFLASMSHEIRTPMNGILGMLGLLESTQLDKEQNQHVRLAKSSADALLVLINDILDFSKIEAGKLSLENVEFDMVNLVAEVASSVSCVAEDKQLEIVLDVADAEHLDIVGDPGRIRQVLNNLIGNAIKFTEQGYIFISATSYDQVDGACLYEVTIEDTGVGIPPDRLNAVFDSFSQVDASTTRKFGGTGLGLTICKQLAELMGGDIVVESELGKGSRFTFKFHASIAKRKHKDFDFSNLGAITIAHVDSTLPCLNSVKKQLEKWGIASLQFKDQESLLTEISTRDIDIALISSSMQGMDPKKLCDQIRAQSVNSNIKLCILTKLSELQNDINHGSLNVDGYFPKPVTQTELHDALLLLSKDNVSEVDPSVSTIDTGLDCSGLRALLVEDNPINQILAVTLLEGLGLKVDVANHGKEALVKLEKDKQYKMIFMDCQMPEMDGYEATQRIRSGECGVEYKEIPIIAMTANAITGDREKCLDAGMSDYISKPIDTDILKQRVAHWCAVTGSIKKGELTHDREKVVGNAPQETAAPPKYSLTENEDVNVNENEIIWKKDEALERTLGREDLLCRVIDAYLKDTPSLVERLNQSIKDQDMEEIAYLAHTIKGSSLNVSAQKLSELAALIELDAKAGEQQRMASVLADLNWHSEKLFAVLQSYREPSAS